MAAVIWIMVLVVKEIPNPSATPSAPPTSTRRPVRDPSGRVRVPGRFTLPGLRAHPDQLVSP